MVWPVNPEELTEIASSPAAESDDAADELWGSIDELSSDLRSLGVGPTHRFLRSLRAATRLGNPLGSDPVEILDALVLGKILPGVVVLRSERQKRLALDEVGAELARRSLHTSAAALERVSEALDYPAIAKVL